MIILEQCTVRVEPPSNHVPYGFSIGKYHIIRQCLFFFFFPFCSFLRYIDDTSSLSSSSSLLHPSILSLSSVVICMRVRLPVSRSVRARRQKHRRKNVAVFDGGLFQQLGANTAEERDSWLQALQLASYECMRNQLLSLRQRIEAFSGHKHDTDIQMLRLQRGTFAGCAYVKNFEDRTYIFLCSYRCAASEIVK